MPPVAQDGQKNGLTIPNGQGRFRRVLINRGRDFILEMFLTDVSTHCCRVGLNAYSGVMFMTGHSVDQVFPAVQHKEAGQVIADPDYRPGHRADLDFGPDILQDRSNEGDNPRSTWM